MRARSIFQLLPSVVFALALAACGKSSSASSAPASVTSASVASAAASPLAGGAAAKAVVGQPAPDFTLTDVDGKTVSLHDFKGKTVVLEWFNPGCPFVKKAHTVGSLKGMESRVTAKGVVWIAVNSAASGKQGFGADANREGKQKLGLAAPVLLDATGAVGTRTARPTHRTCSSCAPTACSSTAARSTTHPTRRASRRTTASS